MTKKRPTHHTSTSIATVIRWRDDVLAEVRSAAKAQGRSFSEFVRTAALEKARKIQ